MNEGPSACVNFPMDEQQLPFDCYNGDTTVHGAGGVGMTMWASQANVAATPTPHHMNKKHYAEAMPHFPKFARRTAPAKGEGEGARAMGVHTYIWVHVCGGLLWEERACGRNAPV